jgi:protein-L-isoaspartate(D-aspartate) O-methyltransferase
MTPVDVKRGIGMTSQRTRERLVQQLREDGICDERVLQTIRDVPRHLFVDEALATRAYENTALPIGHGQTISQPYIVARMTEALLGCEPPLPRSPGSREGPGRAASTAATGEAQKRPADPPCGEADSGQRLAETAGKRPQRVLEVGTGSGYQTAVLAALVDEVYTVERLEPLMRQARKRLRELGYRNVHVKLSAGGIGWPQHAPYDGILVTAAAPVLPSALLEQLAPGGCLVAPVGGPAMQELWRVRRAQGDYTHERLELVNFVPLILDN